MDWPTRRRRAATETKCMNVRRPSVGVQKYSSMPPVHSMRETPHMSSPLIDIRCAQPFSRTRARVATGIASLHFGFTKDESIQERDDSNARAKHARGDLLSMAYARLAHPTFSIIAALASAHVFSTQI